MNVRFKSSTTIITQITSPNKRAIQIYEMSLHESLASVHTSIVGSASSIEKGRIL